MFSRSRPPNSILYMASKARNLYFAMFHSKCGALVSLSNNNRTAQRNHPSQEFNNGVVLSRDVLQDDQLFEVTIDKKVSVDYQPNQAKVVLSVSPLLFTTS